MLEQIKKYLTPILLFLLAGLVLLQLKTCSGYSNEKKILEQNIAALKDSTRLVKNRVGELEAVRLSLVGDKDILSKLNAELKAELDKEKGNVKFISKTKIEYQSDTVYIRDSQKVRLDSGVYGISWFTSKFDDGLDYTIFGETRFKVDTLNSILKVSPVETIIYQNKIKFRTVFGYTEVENGYQVFIRTNNPNVTFDIEGGFIDKTELLDEDHFSIGPYLGVGLSAEGKFQPHVGVGLMYKIISF